MSSVAIYMEGGGQSRDTKAALRQGMDEFLHSIKEAVRNKSWRWKLVPCGGRDQAYNGFANAVRNDTAKITILLVDAEDPVEAPPREHLRSRDGWDFSFAADDNVHLMVQTMETWIVADPGALADYYGQYFQKSALPPGNNLETVAKVEIAQALERATRMTQKGDYHKIHHASELLKRIDPSKVRLRCSSCERLFDILSRTIEVT